MLICTNDRTPNPVQSYLDWCLLSVKILQFGHCEVRTVMQAAMLLCALHDACTRIRTGWPHVRGSDRNHNPDNCRFRRSVNEGMDGS